MTVRSTPRADSIEENMARVETHKLSRYPYVDTDSNIIGIVHLKDLLLPQRELQRDTLEKAAKPRCRSSRSSKRLQSTSKQTAREQ